MKSGLSVVPCSWLYPVGAVSTMLSARSTVQRHKRQLCLILKKSHSFQQVHFIAAVLFSVAAHWCTRKSTAEHAEIMNGNLQILFAMIEQNSEEDHLKEPRITWN